MTSHIYVDTNLCHSCRSNSVRRATSQVAASSQTPGQQAAAAALGALLTFGSVAGPMLAAPDAALAARSGGRAGGGRSFSSRPAPSRASAPRTTVNNNYISGGGGGVRYMPSPVMGFGYSPFYSPFGGMGTGYALGSMAGGGQRYETNRLENEVRFWACFFFSRPELTHGVPRAITLFFAEHR